MKPKDQSNPRDAKEEVMPVKPPKAKKDSAFYLEFIKQKFTRYRVIIFAIFVALVYAFTFLQINNFANAKPDPIAVANQQHISAKIPHIDPATIQKIQQLKDNSVNVQALFNNARQNPFSQ